MNPPLTDEAEVKILAQALVQLAREPDAQTWGHLTDQLRKLQCHSEALEFLRIGVERFPEDAELQFNAGRQFAECDDHAAAAQALRRCLDSSPQHIDALWLLANLSRRMGDLDQARMRLSQLLHVQPDHEQARDLLRSISAAPAKAASVTPAQKTFSTVTLAEIYVKQGYLSKALHVYQQLLDSDPENEKIRRRLDQLRAQMGAPAGPIGAASDVEARVEAPAPAELSQETAPEHAPAPAEVMSYEQRMLQTFENWLKAISQRRSHVH
jgi:tetratricopeptide (TPR) repeat protein